MPVSTVSNIVSSVILPELPQYIYIKKSNEDVMYSIGSLLWPRKFFFLSDSDFFDRDRKSMLVLSIKHLTLFPRRHELFNFWELVPYGEADQSKSKTLFLFACHITSCEVFLLDIFPKVKKSDVLSKKCKQLSDS